MSSSYSLQILTPSGELFSKEGIEFMKLPAYSGEVGVLPSHSHAVVQLIPGEMILKQGEREDCFFISKGVAHITPTTVTLFSSYMESVTDIDNKRASQAKERALKRVKSKDKLIDRERARQALIRAELRLSIKKTGHN
jgi:F-type H+-transporting ATPase subunit epsilon